MTQEHGRNLPSLVASSRVDRLCERFEAAWNSSAPDSRPRVDDFLRSLESDADQTPLEWDQLRRKLTALELILKQQTPHQAGERGMLCDVEDEDSSWGPYATETLPHDPLSPAMATPRNCPEQPVDKNAAPNFGPRYEYRGELGRGGFGSVYRAFDRQLQREVALKVLDRPALGGPDILGEARSMARCPHPHIVPVFDAGELPDGRGFISSQLFEGGSLAVRLKRGRLDQRQSAELVAELADALATAHEAGHVHRDVKPGNILLDKSGRAYLSDFGLAMRDENYGHGHGLLGTLRYMSPEQAAGKGHIVDGRADIYSLGVVLYELLTGRSPYRATDSKALLDEIKSAEVIPRPPRQLDSNIPEELERICLKAMRCQPERRYSSARDMVVELQAWLDGTGELPALSPRRSLFTGAVAALNVMAIAAALWALFAVPWGGADSYSSGLNQTASSTAPLPVEGTTARLIELGLYVRRHRDDDRVTYRRLVESGNAVALPPVDPLILGDDDFALEGRFDRATHWCVLQFDPQAGYAVVGGSTEPSTAIRLPASTGKMAQFNAADGPGANVLLVLASDVPMFEASRAVEGRFAIDPDLLARVPTAWSQSRTRDRAGLVEVETNTHLAGDFLAEIEESLPAGLQSVHAVYLQTKVRDEAP